MSGQVKELKSKKIAQLVVEALEDLRASRFVLLMSKN